MEPLVISYTLLLQGLPGQGGHGLWLALDQDQPKGSVSLTLDFSERMLDKKVWTVSCHSVIRILTFACDA